MTIRFLVVPALLASLAAAGPLTAASSAQRTAKPVPAEGDSAPVLVSKDGGKKSPWKDLAGLKAAADQGNPKACYDLALLCLEGSPPDVPRDPARAVKLYEQAARGGLNDAWFRLGKIFHDGVGGPADVPRAYQYYLESARRGVPEAQHNVGAMLVSGRGVKRDYVEGLAWLLVAAKSGIGADDVAKVRAHLARKPNQIAAAERRAAELSGPAPAAPAQAISESPANPARPPVAIETTSPKIKVEAPAVKPDLPLPPPALK